MAWKIEPEWKKSITQTDVWINDKGHQIVYNLGWRWGTYVVEEPENMTIEQFLEEYDEDDGINITDEFTLIDSEESDSVWDDYDYYYMSDAEVEEIGEFFDEGNSVYDLEEHGWKCINSYTTITGPIKIEKVD